MVTNASLVLLFLAAGVPGLSQAAASAPSRSLRGNDQGDVEVPRLNFRQQFDDKDFAFDLQGAEPEIEGEAGTVKVANLGNVPVLSGEGVSFALVELEPCGLNLPHHHPRAAEFGYIVKSESATSVRHAFVEENTGRLIKNDIGEGQVALVPGGLVHFVQNMGCEPATFLAAFSSSDPGVLTTSTTGIGMLPEGTIQATLGLGSDEANKLIDALPEGVVQGEKECLQKCGLAY
eukprot:jgi/Undpi1/4388/HiC_scaffold_17.g07746.m1